MEKYRYGLIYDLCSKGKYQIDILEEFCVRVAAKPVTLINFLKLQADIYRYMAEQMPKYNEKKDQVNLRDMLPKKYLDEKGI